MKRLGEMICADIQPMSIVEDVGFQWFVEAACPHYQFPSRKHMKNEIIKDSIYGKMVAEMTAHFAKVDFVSCTSDLWTADNSQSSFISITVQWLTQDFHQQHMVLKISGFDKTHS